MERRHHRMRKFGSCLSRRNLSALPTWNSHGERNLPGCWRSCLVTEMRTPPKVTAMRRAWEAIPRPDYLRRDGEHREDPEENATTAHFLRSPSRSASGGIDNALLQPHNLSA